MADSNEWADLIIAQIEAAEANMEKSDARELQLSRLAKLTRRVAGFPDCDECAVWQTRIGELTGSLKNSLDREARRNFLAEMHLVMQHLHRKHRLSPDGQNLAIGMSVGIALGMITGAAIGNPGVGIAGGLGLGLATGAWLDARARQKGLVI